MTVPGVWPQARHRWNFDYWAAKHTRGHCTDGRVRQVKLPQKSANTALSSILKCRRGGLHFSRGGRRREARSRWAPCSRIAAVMDAIQLRYTVASGLVVWSKCSLRGVSL